MSRSPDDWGKSVDASVDRAREQRYTFRRSRSEALARFKSTRKIELLVDGKWVSISKPLKFHKWKRLDDDELRAHGHGYLIEVFGTGPTSGRERWQRVGIVRLFKPPLPGGAERKPDDKIIQRAQRHRAKQLPGVGTEELSALEVQATLGHTTLAERCAVMEQRANFFLGAAGLSTSLVLANSGLLLSDGKLTDWWLSWAAALLAAATVCAVIAGSRAMQAAMATFIRAMPNGTSGVIERSELRTSEQTKAYVGALLVAQNREEAIGDWKLARLKSARRWFLALIIAIAMLAGVVLLDVLGEGPGAFEASPARPAPHLADSPA